MTLDCALAEHQTFGNLAVCQSVGDEGGDFELASRRIVWTSPLASGPVLSKRI